MNPELTSKPLGIIMPRKRERELLAGLSPHQRGYVAHYLRSNPGTTIAKAVKKAKEQRPGPI